MKVTVCFGDMKIIVPCGDGQLLVSELIERAVNRYKKTSQKVDFCKVQVKYLETVEHARLDLDDQVMGVCDDKDMLIAIYNEVLSSQRKNIQETDNGGKENVTCGSTYTHKKDEESVITSTLSDNDSGVAADSYGIASNPDSANASLNSSSKPPRGLHRRTSLTKNASFRSSLSSHSPSSSPELPRMSLKPNAFARDSNRKSLSSNHPILYKWIDQQEKANYIINTQSFEETDSEKSIESEEIILDQNSIKCIDIKPYTNAAGTEIGLIVHNIIEGSYVNCIGVLQVADRITEINGISLLGYSNSAAMEFFTEALKLEEIKIKRTRSHSFVNDQLKATQVNLLHQELNSEALKEKMLEEGEVPLTKPKEAAVEAPMVNEEDLPSDAFTVNLIKGQHGLGFTLTSKDVVTSKRTPIFVKNVLSKGAANDDGRIRPGDELLMVNDVSVSNKSQGEVVKLLRQAQGQVALKLSRSKYSATVTTATSPKPPQLNQPIPPLKTHVEDILTTNQQVQPVPQIKTQEYQPPIVKTSTPEVPRKFVLPEPPPVKIQMHQLPIMKNQQGGEIKLLVPPKEVTKREIADEREIISVSEKGATTLTVPVATHKNASLGVSVKGRIFKDSGEEKGIFVSSIVKDGLIDKDGRIFVGDQLLGVNSSSFTGIGNIAAMNILKKAISELEDNSFIYITVKRKDGISDTGSARSSISQSTNNSLGNRNDERADLDKQSNNIYLTAVPAHLRTDQNIVPHGINRTRSYFKAVTSPKPVSVKTAEIETAPKSQPLFYDPSGNPSPKENAKKPPLPAYRQEKGNSRPSNRAHYEDDMVSVQLLPPTYSETGGNTTNLAGETGPPTYEQALKNKENLILPTPPSKSTGSPRNSPAFPNQGGSDFQTSHSIDGSIKSQDGEVDNRRNFVYSMSQCSIDSLASDLPKVPFARDGFGRLSVSEKKGRAHIDANKSEFFNKLKKFKSMEELRAKEGDEFVTNFQSGLRRTSSIDTIASRRDEDERNFNRGTVYSSSTPWSSHEDHRNREEQRMRSHGGGKKSNSDQKGESKKELSGVVLRHPAKKHAADKVRPLSWIEGGRSLGEGKKYNSDQKGEVKKEPPLVVPRNPAKKRAAEKVRPLSWIEGGRLRNTVLNESFRSALERSKPSQKSDADKEEEKKKSGFFKGLNNLLKKTKKRKEDEEADFIIDPVKYPFTQKALLDVYEDVENNNKPGSDNTDFIGNTGAPDSSNRLLPDHLKKQLAEETRIEIIRNLKSFETDSPRFLQPDRVQQKLVEAKINEMHRERKEMRQKKSDAPSTDGTPKKDQVKNKTERPDSSPVCQRSDSTSKNDQTKRKTDRPDSSPVFPSGDFPSKKEKNDTLTGYSTWDPDNPRNMRERSKQFFTRDITTNQSNYNKKLQRKCSLPSSPPGEYNPDVPLVLPRAPTGARVTPEPRKKRSNDNRMSEAISIPYKTTNINRHDSDSRTFPRRHDKDSPLRTTNIPGSVEQKNRSQGSFLSCSSDPTHSRKLVPPSMGDLRQRSSVTISHTAQI